MEPASSSLQEKQKGPRACGTCAKAKARCIPGPAGDICERCHRLNKPCSSQTPAPPRKRKAPKKTPVSDLERRLDDLTARLESAADSGSGNLRASNNIRFVRGARFGPGSNRYMHIFPSEERGATGAEDDELDEDGDGYYDDEDDDDDDDDDDGWAGGRAVDGPVVAGSAPCWRSIVPMGAPPTPRSSAPSEDQHQQQTRGGKTPSPWPEGDEAEMLLAEYREQMTSLFPFVVVPAGMSSDEIRRRRPFLWKGVMMQGAHLDGVRQVEMGRELLRGVAAAAITVPQKGVDLLQGLLILVAWYHFNLNSFQMTNLLFLARSICVSLGFSESARSTKHREHTPECREEMRAFAGSYYAVTLVFTTNKKPDALMNTSYLEACCGVLERAMEYPTDELLVYLVRTQQLAQSISMTLAFRSSGMQMELPVTMLVKGFQQQIEALKASLRPSIQRYPSVMAHIHIAEMLLYEIAIYNTPQGGPYIALTDRLELLWACLRACRTFLTTRFAAAVGDTPRFVCMSAFDFVYCFMTCLRLSALQLPGWDLVKVREELDFETLVERQVRDLRQIVARRKKRRRGGAGGGGAGGADGRKEEDPYEMLARKLEHMMFLLSSELADFRTLAAAACASASASAPASASATADPPVMGLDVMDSMDMDMDMSNSSVELAAQGILQDMDASSWRYFLASSVWGPELPALADMPL